MVLTVEMVSAFKREFDPSGKEIGINAGKSKKVSTGYLNTSYSEKVAKESGSMSVSDLRQKIGDSFQKLHGSLSGNMLGFWGEEEVMMRMDFVPGTAIRLKTRGDSSLIDFICLLENQSVYLSSFGGDNVGGNSSNWSDKVMKLKSEEPEILPQDQSEVADDEWD
eukprot:Lithocolla_globosa_v1_NODE_65_length_7181_cov_9.895453.p3 type:complete len:165 gc:universal NODE_65_length_7181_cov_9.895453:490-984(+)